MSKTKSTRRAFFISGGAALGAGVATAVGAAAPVAVVDDREAIRQLHLSFIALIENERYAAAADLFADNAYEQYRSHTAPVLHRAYRQNASKHRDVVTVSKDRLTASATFHVDVELCTPLQGDCTAAQMARLQGLLADHRWETGRLEARYVSVGGQWKVASLRYCA